ncbi:hypothetical protein B296_00017216, partial [Ensete ventricosum]
PRWFFLPFELITSREEPRNKAYGRTSTSSKNVGMKHTYIPLHIKGLSPDSTTERASWPRIGKDPIESSTPSETGHTC